MNEKWDGRSEELRLRTGCGFCFPDILTSYALSAQSAHLSLHCLTFPCDNVGTEAIPFPFFS